MTTSKSFFQQHKDTFQIVYGTAMLVALYFGLSTKLELLTQKHDSDMTMVNFRINALESNRTSNTDKIYDTRKYAVLPKEIKLNNE